MSQPWKQFRLAVNGSAGALVSVQPTIFCRKIIITECPPPGFDGTNFAPQGMNYTLPDDGFVAVQGNEPGADIVIADEIPMGNAGGRGVGHGPLSMPGQADAPANIVAKLISATATATYVLVRMYP